MSAKPSPTSRRAPPKGVAWQPAAFDIAASAPPLRDADEHGALSCDASSADASLPRRDHCDQVSAEVSDPVDARPEHVGHDSPDG